MEFTEFVDCLYPIISGDKAKDIFVQELFLNITDMMNEENIVEKTSLSTYRSYYTGERTINRFAKRIREYLEPSCFEEYLNNLSDEQCANICQVFSDEISDINVYNATEKLSGLFADIIIQASTKSRKSTKKKRQYMNNDINAPKSEDISSEVYNCNMDIQGDVNICDLSEDVKDEARRFIIEHECEKELFALCQVAFNLNPMHKHARDLYTEYNKCGYEVRKAIMILCDIPILDFENDWDYKYLELFRADIKEQNLCADKDLLYEGGKYLHKAMNYPEELVMDKYKYTFPSLIINHDTNRVGALVDFIDEYIHNNYNLTLDYDGQPPLEWMINIFDMTDSMACPEKQLAIWLNMFVLSACYVIPINYKKKKPEDITFLAPGLYKIETLEDLYYSALLNLYSIYC